MTFVPGYEYDVFISYGHFDDAPPSKDWICDLTTNVEGKLKQICSADVTVWRDPRLMAGDRLNTTIRQAIERSAVFVSILTPGFAEKPWSAKEAEWFMEAVERDNIKLDAKSRIIPVEKYPMDDASIPGALQSDTLRQRFYDPGAGGGPPREYSNNSKLDSYAKFVEACASLAHAINAALKAMRRVHEQLPVQPQQRSIFVAAVSGDARQYRDGIVVELNDRGFAVAQPSLSIEDTDEQSRAAIIESAAGCDIALHIAGDSGLRIGDQPLTVAQFAILHGEAARRPPGKVLKQIVWVPSDEPTAIEEVRRTFVAAVTPDATPTTPFDFEVLGGSVATLKEALIDIATAPPPVERQATLVPAVFVLCQQADLRDPQLQALHNWLVAKDWVAELPPFQGDVGLLTHLEERSILEADATLIFYGAAEDSWVLEKRRAIQQAWAKTDSPAPRNRAVYLSVPEDEFKQVKYHQLPKRLLREKDGFRPLLILGDCGPFEQQKLRPLLDQMGDLLRGDRP